MKGMTLASHLKEKDAWDIYYCLIHHPDGPDNLMEKFKAFINHGLVREGLNSGNSLSIFGIMSPIISRAGYFLFLAYR